MSRVQCRAPSSRQAGCLLADRILSAAKNPDLCASTLLKILRILGIGISRESGAFGDLLYFHSDGIGVVCIGSGLAQHRVLRKNLVIELGHQVVLPTLVIAPDLS